MNCAELAFISLGSNLGDSINVIRSAFRRLQGLTHVPLSTSSLWRSSPVDCPPGSPDFVNAVVALVPREGETPESMLEKLQEIEREFGRRPKRVVNEPRPLDLDLLSFRDEVRRSDRLTLPHPRAHQRRFVLEPLAEIASECVLPGQSSTVQQLVEPLRSVQRVERVDAGLDGVGPLG